MSDKPLFQGMDEKERELAPQQVPGDARPAADERDQGAESNLPIGGAVVAAPAGGVAGAGTGPMPTGGVGGAGVAPIPPVQHGVDDEETRRGT
jgi:hypothetical protein